MPIIETILVCYYYEADTIGNLYPWFLAVTIGSWILTILFLKHLLKPFLKAYLFSIHKEELEEAEEKEQEGNQFVDIKEDSPAPTNNDKLDSSAPTDNDKLDSPAPTDDDNF